MTEGDALGSKWIAAIVTPIVVIMLVVMGIFVWFARKHKKDQAKTPRTRYEQALKEMLKRRPTQAASPTDEEQVIGMGMGQRNKRSTTNDMRECKVIRRIEHRVEVGDDDEADDSLPEIKNELPKSTLDNSEDSVATVATDAPIVPPLSETETAAIATTAPAGVPKRVTITAQGKEVQLQNYPAPVNNKSSAHDHKPSNRYSCSKRASNGINFDAPKETKHNDPGTRTSRRSKRASSQKAKSLSCTFISDFKVEESCDEPTAPTAARDAAAANRHTLVEPSFPTTYFSSALLPIEIEPFNPMDDFYVPGIPLTTKRRDSSLSYSSSARTNRTGKSSKLLDKPLPVQPQTTPTAAASPHSSPSSSPPPSQSLPLKVRKKRSVSASIESPSSIQYALQNSAAKSSQSPVNPQAKTDSSTPNSTQTMATAQTYLKEDTNTPETPERATGHQMSALTSPILRSPSLKLPQFDFSKVKSDTPPISQGMLLGSPSNVSSDSNVVNGVSRNNLRRISHLSAPPLFLVPEDQQTREAEDNLPTTTQSVQHCSLNSGEEEIAGCSNNPQRKYATGSNACADVKHSSSDAATPKLVMMLCRAVHQYGPKLDDELELRLGDWLVVYELFDDGWCFARLVSDDNDSQRSLEGICPKACLAVMDQR